MIGGLAALAAVMIAHADRVAAPDTADGKRGRRWRDRRIGRRARPVIGSGVDRLLNRRELPWLTTFYDHSILAPWLAQTLRVLPAVVLVLWAAFRSVPREVLELAAVDGASPVRQFVSIALPMRWRPRASRGWWD